MHARSGSPAGLHADAGGQASLQAVQRNWKEAEVAKLVFSAGIAGQREIVIERNLVIGRSDECDVVIAQTRASRRHAALTVSGDSYFIQDMATPNGTHVNGTRITRARLADGDKILVGDTEMTFFLLDDLQPLERAPFLDETQATVTASVVVGGRLTPGGEGTDSVVARRLKSHLNVVQEVSESVCGNLELEHLIRGILKQLLDVFPQAEHAHAVLFDLAHGGTDLHLSAARSALAGPEVGMSKTLLDIAKAEKKAMLATDVSDDTRFSGAMSIVGQSLRSMMCSPLLVAENVRGAIQVDTSSAALPFTTDDLHLLVTVAGQAAVAAENARLHRELVAQQRLAAIGQTISSLAHCIKNVINGLNGGAYILDIGVKKQDPEKTEKGWEMVKRNTDFMFVLVKDMLTYCRKENVSRRPTDLAKLLQDTVLMVQEAAAQRGVAADFTVGEEMPQLSIDATAITRVVLNLVTNAVEACPEGGHVKVAAALDDDGKQVCISVQDDGHGISEEVKQHLFEPLFTTKGSRGTGLGLALVNKAVEEHKGRVEVESEVGRGTTFRIHLPLDAGTAETSVTA